MANPDEKSKKELTSIQGEEQALDVISPGETAAEDELVHKNDSAGSGIERERWGSKMQFLMSCIASAVGLGNVWRFPAICATNGGAAFLIPYFIVLTLIARPLFVLELALGQFSSKGSVRCWDMSPIFTGIGIAGCVSSVLLSTFYIMLLAWALMYTVIGFTSICYDWDGTPLWTNIPGKFFGMEVLQEVNFDSPLNVDIVSYKPIAHLVLALMFAWGIVWITMVFGVEASGKVAYVTALAPYVVLFTLLIAGLCLPGMKVGLIYLFKPDPAKLIDANTWFQAVGQCFFSLGIGFGGCIMFSSYNEFHNNIIRDVLIIAVVDSLTSILAGMSLLSILGFQADHQYTEVKKNKTSDDYTQLMDRCVKRHTNETWKKFNNDEKEDALKECQLMSIIGDTGGAGLAFVHYPNAMNKINEMVGHPFGTILGCLFFVMLILLAVGSANGFVGTTVTILSDKKPKWKRSNIVSGVCAFSCTLGMIYTNSYGAGWFDVVDIHGVTAVVYILAFLEAVTVVYVYGLKNFCDDLQFMRNGKKVGWYFRITWATLPFLMIMIYMYWLITYKSDKHWTPFVKVIGWVMTTACVMIIPITAVVKYVQFRKNPWRRNAPLTFPGILKAITNPSPRWGPNDPQIRVEWKAFKAETDPSWHIWKRFLRSVGGKPADLEIERTPRMSFASNAFPSMTDGEMEAERGENAGTGGKKEENIKADKSQNIVKSLVN